MSRPSARLGDLHMCSMTPVPPGLPIAPPCLVNVLVAKLPAARLGDFCVCVGPPPANIDPIVMGSTTVLFGNMPAARIGDPTLKGGVITTGAFNVLIGG